MSSQTSEVVKNDIKGNNSALIAIVIFGMYASFGMSWMSVVPLIQDIETALSISHSEFSWIISIISLAKSFFPIVAGILAARIGLTSTLKISGLLIFLGILIPWIPNYAGWLISRFLFGVGGAMWVTLMGAVTMKIFPPEKRPLINSLNGVAVNLGVTLALWYTIPLMSALGWKTAMSLYSILSGIFFVLLLVSGGIKEDISNTSKTSNSDILKGYVSTLKMPVTWIVSLAFTGPLALYLVFNTWLPVYYQETLKLAKPEVMSLMGTMNLFGIPASIVTGILLQKFKNCKIFILIASIFLPIVSYFAVRSTDVSSIKLLLPLVGVGMFLSVSPLITLLQNQPNMSPAIVGMILGTMFSVTYIVSSLVPGAVGYGYNAQIPLNSLLVMCCIMAFSPAIGLILKEK
ncbi:MAG: MFS transporter [Candidatus Sericytochromatia bacterium]